MEIRRVFTVSFERRITYLHCIYAELDWELYVFNADGGLASSGTLIPKCSLYSDAYASRQNNASGQSRHNKDY